MVLIEAFALYSATVDPDASTVEESASASPSPRSSLGSRRTSRLILVWLPSGTGPPVRPSISSSTAGAQPAST